MLNVEKVNNSNKIKDSDTKIKKLQTNLSEANRKTAEKLKELNKQKKQINTDIELTGTPNIVDVSIDENMNVWRNNKTDEYLSENMHNNFINNHNHFMDDFIEFKKFITFELQSIRKEILRNQETGWNER